MTVETIKKAGDAGIIQETIHYLVEKVLNPVQKNLLVGCTSTKFNVDTNKDVLFLDKIMDVFPNKETSALFTPFVIKLKQICNRGHATLHKRIKTNHEVKRIIKSGNNDKSVVAHEGTSLNHLDLNFFASKLDL